MDIKVLGTGCSRCNSLEKVTKQAVEELGIPASIEKIEDIQQIMSYGILRTPGLIIDGKVVITGQVPGIAEMKEMIKKHDSN
ncbi:MAG: TM0996/MTH895 family glutaredoxin-like protein [Bacteroidales bacterium]|nr:TM0996/MTH895 family glutaredoxin-like protein [Bacteroidales bacterium]